MAHMGEMMQARLESQTERYRASEWRTVEATRRGGSLYFEIMDYSNPVAVQRVGFEMREARVIVDIMRDLLDQPPLAGD